MQEANADRLLLAVLKRAGVAPSAEQFATLREITLQHLHEHGDAVAQPLRTRVTELETRLQQFEELVDSLMQRG